MTTTPEDPRLNKGKSSKNFAIYAIAAVAVIYILVRIFLYLKAGE